MRRIVAVVAAGIMVAGTAALAAPAASAYPAGSDPKIAIVGPDTVLVGSRVAVKASNFTPGCTAQLTVSSPQQATIKSVPATVGPDGSVEFTFRVPPRKYLFVTVQQTKVLGTCAGFHPSTAIQSRLGR
jgi:hypothetical protein